MELDKAARFVEDLLDFESDIGEEDEEDDKRRKVLCKHDPTSSAFGVLCPEDATRVLPVSFIGFFCVVFWFFFFFGREKMKKLKNEFGGDSAESEAYVRIPLVGI